MFSPTRLLAYLYQFFDKIQLEHPALLKSLAESTTKPTAENDFYKNLLAISIDAHEYLLSFNTYRTRCESIRQRKLGRVLDYGAGTGLYFFGLRECCETWTCVDINPLKLEFLRFISERNGFSVETKLVNELTSSDANYDTAICINVLDHNTQAAGILTDLTERIRPEGYLYLYAHFQPDGYHISDRKIVHDVFKVLLNHYIKSNLMDERSAGLEIWQRYADSHSAKTTDPRCAAFPVLNPETRIIPKGHDLFVLRGAPFYLGTGRVSRAVKDILLKCDGTASLEELAARFSVAPDRLQRILAELTFHNHIVFEKYRRSPEDAVGPLGL